MKTVMCPGFIWRTQQGQEVDFILKTRSGLTPFDVKLRFAQWNRSAMKYFCQKYNVADFFCVALDGALSGPEYIYPWQV